MEHDENARLDGYDQKVSEIRREVARLLEQLDEMEERVAQSVRPDQEGSGWEAAAEGPAALSGQPVIAGQSNSATSETGLVASGFSGTALSVQGSADGISASGTSIGIAGFSPTGEGARGFGPEHIGVLGMSINRNGVYAFSANGTALQAHSNNGDGVRASTQSNASSAIFAESGADFPGGATIVALGQVGTGLYASGSHAAVQLGRAQQAGPPTTGFHVAGELVLDANADLYLCKATGNPGTWAFLG